MNTMRSFIHALLCCAILRGLVACGSPSIPAVEPGAPPPPTPPARAPEQFQLQALKPAEPPALAPVPTPPLRVAAFVRVTAEGGEAVEAPVLEGLVAEAIQASRPPAAPDPAGRAPVQPGPPGLELVNRQVYEKALTRDVKALLLRKLELDAEVLRNLAAAGVDLFALGEISTSSHDPVAVGNEVRPLSHAADAAVSMVKVDDGTTLAVGTGSSRGRTPGEVQREAIRSAAAAALAQFHERRGDPVTHITLVIEGLRDEASAARLEKALRSTRGVFWVKPPSFQLGPTGSIARFEVGWSGDPGGLKQVLRDFRDGFRLAGTTIEGNRWSFRAAEEGKP